MTGKKTTLLTLLVAVAIGGSTAVFVHNRTPQTTANLSYNPQNGNEASSKSSSSAETETNRLLQSLAKDMAEMRGQIAKLEQRNVATTSDQQSPATTEEATPPLSQAEQERQRDAAVKAQRELLESSLKRQPKDKAWVNGAQSKLSTAYSTASAQGVRFIDADCRSTMCQVKMELDQSDRKSEQELRKLMNKPSPWPGTRMMHLDRQTGEVIMYVMREGHQLPNLAEESVTAQ